MERNPASAKRQFNRSRGLIVAGSESAAHYCNCGALEAAGCCFLSQFLFLYLFLFCSFSLVIVCFIFFMEGVINLRPHGLFDENQQDSVKLIFINDLIAEHVAKLLTQKLPNTNCVHFHWFTAIP